MNSLEDKDSPQRKELEEKLDHVEWALHFLHWYEYKKNRGREEDTDTPKKGYHIWG